MTSDHHHADDEVGTFHNVKSRLAGALMILAFVALFVGSVALVRVTYTEKRAPIIRDLHWWQKTLIYHIFVPSFYDSDGNGVGDIRGILTKLDYIQSLGIDSLWLSAFYEFGGLDMGHDVKDHQKVDPIFGTMQDVDELFDDLKRRGINVILEFIPNHTSNQSEWFQKSVKREGKYADYYIWRNASGLDGQQRPLPPDDQLAITSTSAWTFNEERGQFYLHRYLPQMPDLDLDNAMVISELQKILRFWLGKEPVMGIRIGGINVLVDQTSPGQMTEEDHLKALIKFIDQMKKVAEEFSESDDIERLFLLEALHLEKSNDSDLMEHFYHNTSISGLVTPFTFGSTLWHHSGSSMAEAVQELVETYLKEGPGDKGWPCWELNDHDTIRGGSGRISHEMSELLLMSTMLLPGTVIVYYGDEIGMANGTDISYEDTRDPYALEPFANASNYHLVSRDPSRTPMQWTDGLNGGFTSANKPWLPLNKNYRKVNVESTKNIVGSDLQHFHKMSALRHQDTFYDGEVYFPFEDKNIFSFMRKSHHDPWAFLVAINFGNSQSENDTAELQIDFTKVFPGVPRFGDIILSANGRQPTNTHRGLPKGRINLSNVLLHYGEGAIILIEFDNKDENKK